MSKANEHVETSASERVKASAAAEKKLMRQEADATKRLNKAQKQFDRSKEAFDKASEKHQRRLAALSDATRTLSASQSARAAGPSSTDGGEPLKAELTGELPPNDSSPKPEPEIPKAG